VLTQLVNKSLVVADREQGQETRYRLLETIRQYALERLAASGEADAIRRQHLNHYLALVEQAGPELDGAQPRAWLDRLRQDYDNLQAALGWIIEQDAAELGLRLVRTLEGFWFLAGYISEGVRWATALVAQARPAWPVELRARVLHVAGFMVFHHGDYATARGLLEECEAIYRQLGDKRSLPPILTTLGRVLLFRGEQARARVMLEECTALCREIGDHSWLAASLLARATVAIDRADYRAAHAFTEQSLSIYQTLVDPWGIAQTVNYLGDIARCEGDYKQAAAHYQESLTLFQAQGIQVEIAAVLHNLGYVALAQGDPQRARACFAESLALHREQSNRPGILEGLAGFGGLVAAQGQSRRAAVLFGAVTALRAALNTPMWPAERVEYERHITAVRAQLDEATFAAAWAEGRAMTLEQALAEALDEGAGPTGQIT
jgi:tetratricopeptide (TPR) repeat protein